MRTLVTKFFGLWLAAHTVAVKAQLPPPPAEGPATARPTNIAGAATNTSIFSRNSNFGRMLRTNPPMLTNFATPPRTETNQWAPPPPPREGPQGILPP